MTDLFACDAPVPSNEAQAHHVKLYAHLRESEPCGETRDYVRALWTRFAALGIADLDFAERFATECASRIWELQVATTFASWGWKLKPSATRGAGMDFGVECTDGATMWVEATTPTPGSASNPDRVHEPPKFVHARSYDEPIMLRCLAAIREKREHWVRAAAAGLVDPNRDGLVIAISGALLPEAMFDGEETPRIVRALLGVGVTAMSIPLDGSSPPRVVAGPPMSFVRRRSGAEVSTRLFADGSAPEVSAVLFSPSYVKERPEIHGKAAGSDFILVLNPFAALPFDLEAPRTGRVFYVGLREDDRRDRGAAFRSEQADADGSHSGRRDET